MQDLLQMSPEQIQAQFDAASAAMSPLFRVLGLVIAVVLALVILASRERGPLKKVFESLIKWPW